MGTRRDRRQDPLRACSRSRRVRQDRHHGSPHRQHLRRGQRGGSAVGTTKNGKGTKIMAIADRAGLPVAAWIASASPAEVRLVEDTLDASFYPPLYRATDRRQDLRQQPARPTPARRARDPDDLSEPQQSKGPDPGRTSSAPVQETMEGRAPVRLAPELPKACHLIRAARRQLPSLRRARMHDHLVGDVFEIAPSPASRAAAGRRIARPRRLRAPPARPAPAAGTRCPTGY